MIDDSKIGVFKTKGGSIPFLRLDGKLEFFRSEYPQGQIETEIIQFTSDFCIVKATVRVDTELFSSILGTAHAYATQKDAERLSGKYVELAESRAIARALGFSGYGSVEDYSAADLLKKLHVLGKLVYKSQWDEKRPELVAHVTGGLFTSSRDLDGAQLQHLISGLEVKASQKIRDENETPESRRL